VVVCVVTASASVHVNVPGADVAVTFSDFMWQVQAPVWVTLSTSASLLSLFCLSSMMLLLQLLLTKETIVQVVDCESTGRRAATTMFSPRCLQ